MNKTRHLWQAVLVLIVLTVPQYAQARKWGDVNNDDKVNINDVTTLINYVLAGECPFDDFTYADLDHDWELGIGDVTSLIQMLLTTYSGADRITYTVNGVRFTMCRVEGGTFMMGSHLPSLEFGYETSPVHPVTLSTYYIGQTMLTWEMWNAVMGPVTGYVDITGMEKRPCRGAYYRLYETFCDKLSYLTGTKFRVATEAEWEFAARGGNLSHGYLYAGSDNYEDVAGYYDRDGYDVGMYQPNELGLYDMTGNGYEMVMDYAYLYSEVATEEPLVNPCFIYYEGSSGRMYRSGAGDSGTVYYRYSVPLSLDAGALIGVRIVMVVDE